MCKVKRLMELNSLIAQLENEKKALSAEIISLMENDKLMAEDGVHYAKRIVVADKAMPAKEAYIKKGYEYVRVF